MSVHIDVVGYLLTAITFSVGFLSTRNHATANATLRQASDVSWRVREILTRGDRLSPAELASLLVVVHRVDDVSARFARAANVVLLSAITVLSLDGLRLIAAGAHPVDAALLVLALLTGGIAVCVVGEVDARHVERDLRQRLGATTLGRIENLDTRIEVGDFAGIRREIGFLRRSFPNWGLLVELDAYASLHNSDPERAFETVLRHVDTNDDVYLSALVGAAAAAAMGRHDEALSLLERLGAAGLLSADEVLMRRAFCLRAAHLDELVDGGERRDVSPSAATTPSTGAVVLPIDEIAGLMFEGTAATEQLALDVSGNDFDQLRSVLETLQAWNGRAATTALDPAATDRAGTPFGILSALVMSAPSSPQRADAVASAVELGQRSKDGLSVEAVGMCLLACGEVRPALSALERAAALSPKSPRIHWAEAVSCWRWGWQVKAEESLDRAAGLDPDDPVIAITRLRVAGEGDDEALPTSTLLLPTQRLQLALIRHPVPSVSPPACPREVFVTRLIEAAQTSGRWAPGVTV